MSLQAQPEYSVPAETARVAQAVYPKGNIYLQLYDTFGTLFSDEEFEDLFPADGQPGLSPVRLSLVLILQFMEGLSDRQAADAVRSRIDWKYLLCLDLTDPGFHYSVLSECRSRLLAGGAEEKLFEKMLGHFRVKGLLKKRGQQRTDSTHVLAAIRSLNRVELVGETMRHALNTLAEVAPEWTLAHSQAEWIEWYEQRVTDYHLPKSKAKRQVYVATVGADGLALLTAIWQPEAPAWLRELPAVQLMRRIWLENYTWRDDGCWRWRETKERPPASINICSPYDDEAHFCKKRSTRWLGYKVHLTETCDEDYPRLITHVETTPATTSDVAMTTTIHEALQEKECLPDTHLVDAGYVSAELLLSSRADFSIDLVGPTKSDTHWQARQGAGFTAQDFTVDWKNKQAICPEGKKSLHWQPAISIKGKPVIQIHFSKRDCRACASQPSCTRSQPPRRTITVLPEAQYKTLQTAREREKTEAFSELYAQRAGIEGTISQGVRRSGLRQSRYIGLAKTHLQHIFTAMALNVVRIMNWLAGDLPAHTRQSAFIRLHNAAALAP